MWQSNRLKTPLLSLVVMLLWGWATFASAVDNSKNLSEGEKRIYEALFKATDQNRPQCVIADRGPGVAMEKIDPALDAFLESILEKLRNEDADGFQKLFNARTKVSHDIGEKIIANLKSLYEKPWQFSVYRLWATYDPDATKEDIACPGDEGIVMTTRYGYPIQFGLWIQVMGQNELGRIFVAVTPNASKEWKIVGWHFQQWTHQGKDYLKLIQEADAAARANDPVGAYMSLDAAQKMLFGGEFLTFKVKEDILKMRASLFTPEAWLARIQDVTKNKDVIYAGTSVAKDGIGLLVRQRVPGEVNAEELRKKCNSVAQNLLASKWLSSKTGGLKCEFVMPWEKPEREGKLGGFYMTSQDLSHIKY